METINPRQFKMFRFFKLLSIVLSLVTILVAFLVEIGWTLDITVLKSIVPGIVSMNPHVALCFILAGTSIFLLTVRKKLSYAELVFIYASSIIIFIFGFVRMLGIFNIVDLHLDQILFHEKLLRITQFSNNRIAPNTSVNLIILGVGLYLAARKKWLVSMQYLMLTTFFIALFAILGYSYSVNGLYGFLMYTPMALNTACDFIFVSLALMCAFCESGFMKMISSINTGGIIARRLVPAIIVVPSLLGWLRIYGEHENLFPSEFGTAMFVISAIVFFILLVFALITKIDNVDVVREKAEANTANANNKLEVTNARLDKQIADFELNNQKLEDTKKAMLNLLEDLNQEKEKIQTERAKDEALLGSIGDGVFAIDLKGKIILFNPVAEALSGWNKDEAFGKYYGDVLKFHYESDGKINDAFVKTALAGEKTQMDTHTELLTKNGKRIPVADSAAPVLDKFGNVSGAVIVFRDVTIENQIDKAKTEFVSLASHQLRTPLSAISWYTELVLDGDAGPLTIQQKEFLQQVYDSNKRMIELVNSLLNVSRIELGTLASEPAPTDIIQVNESVLAELKPQIIERELKIEKVYDKNELSMNVDPKLMRIIIQNLLSNSVKYTPEKGTVTVSIKKDAQKLYIDVTDTGLGIPKGEQSKIFTKLYRADNAKEKVTDGNGLGLYMVKSIIDTQGGKIWFDSEENKGTIFHIELPASGMKRIEGSKTLS